MKGDKKKMSFKTRCLASMNLIKWGAWGDEQIYWRKKCDQEDIKYDSGWSRKKLKAAWRAARVAAVKAKK